MGFRFRRTVGLGKGVRLNLSKSGVGISAGVKGARVGVGPTGKRASVGLPGTGLRYEKQVRKSKSEPVPQTSTERQRSSFLVRTIKWALIFLAAMLVWGWLTGSPDAAEVAPEEPAVAGCLPDTIAINLADIEDLREIPYIDEVRAPDVVSLRAIRPFKTVADLERIHGIGPTLAGRMAPHVCFVLPEPAEEEE